MAPKSKNQKSTASGKVDDSKLPLLPKQPPQQPSKQPEKRPEKQPPDLPPKQSTSAWESKDVDKNAKEFYCIIEGAGGTMTIDAKDEIRYVGTRGCKDSVGVYFRIDSKRSFCAHLVAKPETSILPENKGKALSDDVCQRLKAHAIKEKWAVEHERFAEQFVIICERPMQDPEMELIKGVGWYLIDGVSDFLQQWCVGRMAAAFKKKPALPLEKLSGYYDEPKKMTEDEKATAALYQRMQRMCALCLNLLEVREEGHRFVVDADAASNSGVVVFKPGAKFGQNRVTELIDESKYVPKEDSTGEGEWCFFLEATMASSGKF